MLHTPSSAVTSILNHRFKRKWNSYTSDRYVDTPSISVWIPPYMINRSSTNADAWYLLGGIMCICMKVVHYKVFRFSILMSQ